MSTSFSDLLIEWEEFLATIEAIAVHQERTQVPAADVAKLCNMFKDWKVKNESIHGS